MFVPKFHRITRSDTHVVKQQCKTLLSVKFSTMTTNLTDIDSQKCELPFTLKKRITTSEAHAVFERWAKNLQRPFLLGHPDTRYLIFDYNYGYSGPSFKIFKKIVFLYP